MVIETVGVEEDKKTSEPSLATLLELLLSVCRENAIDAGYASVSWRNGQLLVGLWEQDFRRMFSGEKVIGPRMGDFVDVCIERHGIKWNSSMWLPVEGQSGTVEMQL